MRNEIVTGNVVVEILRLNSADFTHNYCVQYNTELTMYLYVEFKYI